MVSRIETFSNFNLQMNDGVTLMEHLEHSLSQTPESEELITQMLDLADLGASVLADEEMNLVDRDIEDLTQEVGLEDSNEIEQISDNLLNQDLQGVTSSKKNRKKRHSRGFFKRTARQVAHAVRDTGRFFRGKTNHFQPMNEKVESIQTSKKSSTHKTTSEKVSKFIKKNKKALIIGSIIAVAIIAGAIVVCSSSTAIGASVMGAGSAINASSSSKSILSKNEPERKRDEKCSLNQLPLLVAAEKAKELRYPGLVYSLNEIDQVQRKADQAFQQFKNDLPKIIQISDVSKTIELVANVIITASCPANKVGLVSAISTTGLAKDLVGSIGERIQHLVSPVGEAYSQLYEMKNANARASVDLCNTNGYQPRLEFHPTANTDGIVHMLVDKNNPDQNHQIPVVLP